jgi:hypothetical protein
VRASGQVSPEERELIVRLLTTLLREDVAGLRTRGRLVRGPDGGPWLARHRLRIPVRSAFPGNGDLVSDLAVRAAVVLRVGTGGGNGRRISARGLPGILNLISAELPHRLDPGTAAELATGLRALREEAEAARSAARLRRRRRPAVFGRLRPRLGGRNGLGWAGAIEFETLAAFRDHPLYPFSLARVGLPIGQLPRVAPEHRPQLELRWLRLPASVIEQHGRLPDWWPAPAGTDEVMLPVHPAVPTAVLRQALADLGLAPDPILAGAADAKDQAGGFRPTLSLRTVASVRSPAVHLKLPMPIRTLGRLNLRIVTRNGLADGELVGSVLRQVRQREPEFADLVRIADEASWLHTGNPLLAVLVRRWETDLDQAAIVPVAGLAGIGPDGRPVFAGLAVRFADGDLDRLLGRYLRLLITWSVRLWLRHGIVLEAHPQNVLIAVDRTDDGPRVRLLLRDLDSAKLDLELLAGSLGAAAPDGAELHDPRLAADRPDELADLFVTTTLHQCVAAVLIDLAAALDRPVRPWLALIRPLLAEALEHDPAARDASRFRAGIMESRRLPVKRALTAATLLPKTRTGAADVNKYYGADAPSYL